VQYGECYFEVDKDRADELLESRKDKLAEEMTELEAKVGTIHDTLAKLKTQLYKRFGGNINLEVRFPCIALPPPTAHVLTSAHPCCMVASSQEQ